MTNKDGSEKNNDVRRSKPLGEGMEKRTVSDQFPLADHVRDPLPFMEDKGKQKGWSRGMKIGAAIGSAAIAAALIYTGRHKIRKIDQHKSSSLPNGLKYENEPDDSDIADLDNMGDERADDTAPVGDALPMDAATIEEAGLDNDKSEPKENG